MLAAWCANREGLAQSLQTGCVDSDADGFGRGPDCSAPQDCNDRDATVFPGHAELCNGKDDNCDGVLDEGCVRNCENFQLLRTKRVAERAFDAVIVRAEQSWGAVWEQQHLPTDDVHISARLDFAGNPLAPLETVFTDVATQSGALAWTGSELVLGYIRENSSPDPGARLRNLGRWGNRLGPENHLSSAPDWVSSMSWTGERLCAIHMPDEFPTYKNVLMTRTERDPSIVDDSVKILERTRAEYGGFDALSWTGLDLGWVYTRISSDTGHHEVFFRSLDSDCLNSGPEMRVTDHRFNPLPDPTFADDPAIVSKGLNQGFGVVWTDNRTGREQIWMAILDATGQVLTPPGEFQLSNTQVFDVFRPASIAWNGDEFMVIWVNSDPTGTQFGRLMGTRVSKSGAILQNRVIDPGPDIDLVPWGSRIAWNGKSYGVLFERLTADGQYYDLHYAEVGCNCVLDADHDGLTACNGDCDDGDATSAGNKVENCTDSKDNDCDGLIDCNDPNCAQSGFKPPESKGVKFLADKQTLTWTLDPLAFSYDVARGSLIDLTEQQSFRWGACLASKITSNQTVDTKLPLPEDGFYYLVRGRRSGCLIGTWGASATDAALVGCP